MKTGTRALLVEMSLPVKTYDIDFARHVSNIVYIRWLEDLRLAWLEKYFPLQPQVDDGYIPILTRTNIQYRRPIQLFDRPIGRMWVQSIAMVRVVLAAQIIVDNEICADVVQEGVFANLETGRPMRVPAALQKMFTDWVE